MNRSQTVDRPAVRMVDIIDEYAGQRLDNYLLRELRGVPRSRIYRIIRKGEVRLNGHRVTASTRLVAGDQLRIPPIRVSSASSVPIKNNNILDTIIYDHKLLYVLSKPAGLAVHGGSGITQGVIEALRAALPTERLELVHRLDRETSGCLMVARRGSLLRSIQAALREKPDQGSGLHKYYSVIVHGRWPVDTTRVDAPLEKNTLSSGERISRVSSAGKASATGFRIVARSERLTLLEAEAITGRTHQIRVHCQHVGCPIVGDNKYGDRALDRQLGADAGRLMLHASRLVLPELDGFPAVEVTAPVDGRFEMLQSSILNP